MGESLLHRMAAEGGALSTRIAAKLTVGLQVTESTRTGELSGRAPVGLAHTFRCSAHSSARRSQGRNV